jgi:acetyl-CoA synthetase
MTEPAAPATPPLAAEDAVEAARREAAADAEGYWRRQGRRLAWMRPFTQVMDVRWTPSSAGGEREASHARWYADGVLNVAFNCIDRHLPRLADAPAILFESDDPAASRTVTYADLYSHVCRMANVLARRGVNKGDRVTLMLPAIPELVFAMLACARIGAVHCVMPVGAAAADVARALRLSGSVCVVAADAWMRQGQPVPVKRVLDEALLPEGGVESVSAVLVIRRTGGETDMTEDRDHDYDDLALRVTDEYDPEEMMAEDPLFRVQAVGADGRDEMLEHASGGWLAWAVATHGQLFGAPSAGAVWLAGDPSGIVHHAYGVYAPLAGGGTAVLYEGAPGWPAPERLEAIAERHGVAVVRGLADAGGAAFDAVQEDGGLPLPGVAPVLVNADGSVAMGEASGRLCFRTPWPGQARGMPGDAGRFAATRFAVPGLYATGERWRRDAEGRYRPED